MMSTDENSIPSVTLGNFPSSEEKDIDTRKQTDVTKVLRSPVWKYFKKQSDRPVATCCLCMAEIPTSNFGTSGLFSHLRRHHTGQVEIPTTDCSKSPASPSSRPRTNASPVWQYFIRCVDRNVGICQDCGAEVAVPGGSTTGMFAHLRKYHPDLYRDTKISSLHRSKNKMNLTSYDETLAADANDISEKKKDEILNEQETVLVKSSWDGESLIQNYIAEAYTDKTYTDLYLYCDGGVVLGHRLIMAAASSKLREILLVDGADDAHVVLPGVGIAVAEEFVKRIYCNGDVFIEEFRDLLDMMRISKLPENDAGIEIKATVVPKLETISGRMPSDTVVTNPTNVDVKPEPTVSDESISLVEEDNLILGKVGEEAHKNIEDSQLSHDVKFQADDVIANTTSDGAEVAGSQEYNEIGEDEGNNSFGENVDNSLEMDGYSQDNDVDCDEELNDNTSNERNVGKTGAVRRKKLTAIWLYFKKGESQEERVCELCGVVVRAMNSSTTGMIVHLRAYHKSQHTEWQKIRKLVKSGEGDALTSPMRALMEKYNKLIKTDTKIIGTKKLFKKRGRKASPAMLANAPEIRTCAECGKVFSCRGAMQYHMRVVHSGVRPYSCEFCAKSFARKDSYDSHITQHNAVKPFMCQHCGKTFGRRHTRDVHERSHVGDRRYSCGFCPKKFMSGQQKTAHERVHTGEKPYQCSHCGRTFAQQHQLVTHFRIHSGEKPYNCSKCGQNFRHLSSHRNHRCTSPGPRHQILLETRLSPDANNIREADLELRDHESTVPTQYRLSESVTGTALLKY